MSFFVIWAIRLAGLAVAWTFVMTGFVSLLRFYETVAQEAAAGVYRTLDRERVVAGIGAWARESGLGLMLALLWPLGTLPRGRVRSGAWTRVAGEQRFGCPVLLVPGYAMNRSCMRLLARRLEEVGRPALAIDFPWGKSIEELSDVLAAAVAELRGATGAEKIDIVAHSRGGIVAHWWLLAKNGSSQVERVVTLGTAFGGTKVAGFGIGPSARQMMPGSALLRSLSGIPLDPSVTFYAVNGGSDAMMLPPGVDDLKAPGRNIRLAGLGHSGLLLSAAAWKQIYGALRRPTEDEAKVTGFEDESQDQAASRALAQFGRT